jgi:hypothetical protein
VHGTKGCPGFLHAALRANTPRTAATSSAPLRQARHLRG